MDNSPLGADATQRTTVQKWGLLHIRLTVHAQSEVVECWPTFIQFGSEDSWNRSSVSISFPATHQLWSSAWFSRVWVYQRTISFLISTLRIAQQSPDCSGLFCKLNLPGLPLEALISSQLCRTSRLPCNKLTFAAHFERTRPDIHSASATVRLSSVQHRLGQQSWVPSFGPGPNTTAAWYRYIELVPLKFSPSIFKTRVYLNSAAPYYSQNNESLAPSREGFLMLIQKERTEVPLLWSKKFLTNSKTTF